jgi:hypothetical protein
MGDALEDLNSLIHELQSRLHPSIKKALATRGVKFYLNLYAGFDCEYESTPGVFNSNELISSQLAGNTAIYVKIPKRYKYIMEYINPATSKSSNVSVEGSRKVELKEKVEDSIDSLLKRRDNTKRENY